MAQLNKVNTEKCKELLDKIALIHKYIPQNLEHSFNIFPILRSETDEEGLHSRFIFELLNPNGTHGKGTLFLEKFLSKVDIDSFNIKNVIVEREYKNIDILIKNKTTNQAIIIENKLYANDQPTQLERYYKIIKEEEKLEVRKILYLTLYEQEPNKESLGSLKIEDIQNILYKDHIIDWLEICIKETALSPSIRETILMYQNIIKKLTGQSLERGLIMEIKNLLLENKNNFTCAISLQEALKEAMIDIQYNFWTMLENELEKKYKLLNYDKKYDKNRVRSYYEQSKNNKEYGIRFKFVTKKNNQIIFSIEIYDKIYYGFPNSEENFKPSDDCEQIFNVKRPSYKKDAWGIWAYSNIELPFKNFRDENILNLIEIKDMEETIKKLIKEIGDIVESIN